MFTTTPSELCVSEENFYIEYQITSKHAPDNTEENANRTREWQNCMLARGFKEYKVNTLYQIEKSIKIMKAELNLAHRRFVFNPNSNRHTTLL